MLFAYLLLIHQSISGSSSSTVESSSDPCIFNYLEKCSGLCSQHNLKTDFKDTHNHGNDMDQICTGKWMIMQMLHFELMATVDIFLKEQNITWSLRAGLLIARFLWGGCMIPWDDDIDIAISRDGFEKLTKIFDTSKVSDVQPRHWFESRDLEINGEPYLLSKTKFDISHMTDSDFFFKIEHKHKWAQNGFEVGIDIEPFEFADLDFPKKLEFVPMGGLQCLPAPEKEFSKAYLDRKYGVNWRKIPQDKKISLRE